MTLPTVVPFSGTALAPQRGAGDDPFVRLWNEMDRIFDSFFRASGPLAGGLPQWTTRGSVGMPIEVIEDAESIHVRAELPGVDDKDVEITITGDVLAIKGEKRTEREQSARAWYMAERAYGAFQRSLRLPFPVDADAVQAVFRNGVLTVTLPKPTELRQQVKRIELRQAA